MLCNIKIAAIDDGVNTFNDYSEMAELIKNNVKDSNDKMEVEEWLSNFETKVFESTKIINDLISCSFDNNYYIELPGSFFDKKTKVSRVFKIIDNTFIQDKLRIVITFSTFERYKSYVMDFMRQGFVFAINLDEKFDYSSDNIKFLELFDRIFIEKNKYYFKDMKNNVKISNRIISVDEVK